MEIAGSALLLLLGAVFGWAFKSLEFRRTLKLEAADLVADLTEKAWAENVLDLRIALSKARIRLRTAGVPEDIVLGVTAACLALSKSKYQLEDWADEEEWWAPANVLRDLQVALLLPSPWLYGLPWLPARRRARKAAKLMVEKHPLPD